MAARDGMQPVDPAATGNVPESPFFLHAMLDAVPSPLFVVEDNLRIYQLNRPASGLLAEPSGAVLRSRVGDVLRCIHSKESPEGCGHSDACVDCIVRKSGEAALHGRRVVRDRTTVDLEDGDGVRALHVLVTASPFEHDAQHFAVLILEDISDLVELKSMVPICSYCKKIRNDQQSWQKLESYFKTHMDLDFTHGICPECVDRLDRDVEPPHHD
jgi:nitrogen fixation/metabolism regulation signal transduction histidine kinase